MCDSIDLGMSVHTNAPDKPEDQRWWGEVWCQDEVEPFPIGTLPAISLLECLRRLADIAYVILRSAPHECKDDLADDNC